MSAVVRAARLAFVLWINLLDAEAAGCGPGNAAAAPGAGHGGGRVLLLDLLVPAMGVTRLGLDHLDEQLEVPADLQDGPGVALAAAIVGGAEDGDEAAVCETLKAIQHALVGPDNHLDLVLFAELVDLVGAKADHGLAAAAQLVPADAVIKSRVRPQERVDELGSGIVAVVELGP